MSYNCFLHLNYDKGKGVNMEYEENEKLKMTSKAVNDKNNRKFILYILIALLILSSVTLTIRLGNSLIEKKESAKKELIEASEKEERKKKEYEDNVRNELEMMKKESFNRNFEIYSGTHSKGSVGWGLDEVIKNNKTNSEHLVEVIFNNKSYGTLPNDIKKIKSNLKDFNNYKIVEYEVSYDYDANGYINKMIIEEY